MVRLGENYGEKDTGLDCSLGDAASIRNVISLGFGLTTKLMDMKFIAEGQATNFVS